MLAGEIATQAAQKASDQWDKKKKKR